MNENEEARMRGEADATTPKGYGFSPARNEREEWDILLSLAYSGFASFSLWLALIISAIGCVAILVFGLYECYLAGAAIDRVRMWCWLVGTPVAFVLQFAVFVVFARAVKTKARL